MNIVEQEIAKRNDAFSKASPAEKRVLIAQDIIKQIVAQKIKPMRGAWVETYSVEDAAPYAGFREQFLSSGLHCEACGIGSLLISCTLFVNNVTMEETQGYGNNAFFYPYLREDVTKDKVGLIDLFGAGQLEMIELAFELGRGMFCIEYEEALTQIRDCSKREALDAIAFGQQYKDSSRDRLVEICKNIIAHQGTFTPSTK